MLLRFSVANHRSIAEPVELDLVAAPRLRLHKDHLTPSADGQPPALPVAALFGANGSGKSNVIDALSLAQRLIVSTPQLDAAIERAPFRLDPAFANRPTDFEFVVQVNDQVWTYRFSVSDRAVVSESLTRERANTEEMIFVRRAQEFEWGKLDAKDREFAQFTQRGTLENELFLAAAARKNLDPMQALFRWFQKMIIFSDDSSINEMAMKLDQDPKFRDFVAALLREADTGIQSVEVQQQTVQRDDNPSAYVERIHSAASGIKRPRAIESFFRAPGGELRHLRVLFTHQGANTVRFDFADESRGTQRWYHLSPLLEIAGGNPSLIVVDELDSGLHSHLVKRFIEIFLSTRFQGAQLVFTTHDTNVLDLELLRRDEIWFADKDAYGKTSLTSLYEFINRSDIDLDKHYLAGRFAGIPKLKDVKKRSKNTQGIANGQTAA